MRLNDFILLTLYTISIASSLYILGAHVSYFKGRFKAGVINLFMLAMLFFLVAYTFKMGVAFWIRFDQTLDQTTALAITLNTWLWTFAQFFTTTGLVILAYLTASKRFDLFIYLKKVEPTKAVVVEKIIDEIMESEEQEDNMFGREKRK